MFSIRLRILGTMGAALSVLLLAGGADAAPKQKTVDATALKAAAASPLSAEALEALYAGRTWKWKDGGGFFSADRHRFIAWSQKGRAWSYGQGRWYATNRGKLCLQAYWRSKMSDGGDTTCFVHRQKDGVIYQKRSLGGDWYIFRHRSLRSTDEAAKLIRGDLVRKGFERIKAKAR